MMRQLREPNDESWPRVIFWGIVGLLLGLFLMYVYMWFAALVFWEFVWVVVVDLWR